jgi:hypothetical protein
VDDIVSLYRPCADNEIAMATRPDVIAAAEGLRLWVQRQRATWPTPLLPPIQPAVAAALAPASAAVTFPPALDVMAPPPRSPVPAAVAPIPDTGFTQLRHPPGLAASVTVVRRGAALAAVAFAAIVIVGTAGLAGLWAWGTYVTHAKGTAAITSSPAGAEVLVDGVSIGVTPLNVPLPAGRHVLELRRHGATRAQAVQIARNRESRVNIDWTLRPKGRLRVETDPAGAHVLVDGRDVGIAPLTVSDLSVGGHTVVVDSPAGSVRRRVDITEGATEQLAESIFPGWVRISAPVDVTASEGGRPLTLDDRNRALLKPGAHLIRIDNTALGFSQVRKVEIEPGATADVSIEAPVSTLNVTSNVPADILVDGTKVGEAPIINLTVKLGTRSVVAVDRAGNQQRQTVTITSKPATVDLTFPRP